MVTCLGNWHALREAVNTYRDFSYFTEEDT